MQEPVFFRIFTFSTIKQQPPVGHYPGRKCTEGFGKRAQPPKPSQAVLDAGVMSSQPGVTRSALPLPLSAPPPIMSRSFFLWLWLFCLQFLI